MTERTNLQFVGIPSMGRYPICTNLDELDADIAILGMPYDIGGQARAGMRYGPREIRNQSPMWIGSGGRCYDPEDDTMYLGEPWKIVDCGDVDVVNCDLGLNFKKCEEAVRKIVAKGAVPIVIGGDHSITIPVARALDAHEEIALFHLDAHLDWTNERGGQRFGNGSPCRRISEMPHFKGMASFGIRGIGSSSKSDFADARAYGDVIMSPKEIRKIGVKEAMDRVPQSRKYYVTLDIDCIDGSLAPGCGSPSFGGLTYDEVKEMLKLISQKGEVIGFDLVEVAPPYDPNGITSLLASRLIFDMIGYILKEKEKKL